MVRLKQNSEVIGRKKMCFCLVTTYSVRVSNELGAGNARLAKVSVIVVTMTSFVIGIICMVVVLATQDYFPHLFTNSEAVAKETTRLASLLALTVVLNSVQPVLSGYCRISVWFC